MNVRPFHPQPTTRTGIGRWGRFLVVTAMATPINLALYVWFLQSLGHPTMANLTAATIVTPGTFVANRQWVWRAPDSSVPLAQQITEYWIFTLLAVGVASLVVFVLDVVDAPTAVIVGAPLAVYGVLLVARYIHSDWIFRRRG